MSEARVAAPSLSRQSFFSSWSILPTSTGTPSEYVSVIAVIPTKRGHPERMRRISHRRVTYSDFVRPLAPLGMTLQHIAHNLLHARPSRTSRSSAASGPHDP